MNPYYYIYGPSDIISQYTGQTFTADGEVFLKMGEPIYELNRGQPVVRAYFHHPLNSIGYAYAEQLIINLGLEGIILIAENLPLDWRHPSLF